ncbi:MAG: hypothetical protein M3R13_04620 [Armatimonadota bacterium]|nr:hypothetical protein [Armatimonadota bacterium]
MIAAIVIAAVASGPPIAIPVGDGFILPTEFRTLARYQLEIGGDEEFVKLQRIATANSRRRPPRILRLLHVIAPEIDAQIEDKDGNVVRAKSKMSSAEINRCREWFDNFTNLIFAYTGGALRAEVTEMLLEKPVQQLDSLGDRKYWMSGYSATRLVEENIRENYYDSIGFYYKKPDNMQAGLLGGALGRDYGVRGSAFWTQWITDWEEEPSPLAGAAVVSLHEWLHNITYYAHRVMAYTAVPDCHAAEEYGYWDSDGGYKQWQAWNRDLMLRHIPREFWYALDTRSKQLAENSAAINRALKPGGMFAWRDVVANWHARLPALDDAALQSLTGLKDLRLEVFQSAPNSHVVYRLSTLAKTESSYFDGPLDKSPIKLDNVLSLARRASPSKREDPYGGYSTAPLESMAVLRIPGAPKERRDFLLIRTDLAPYALPLLKVYGRKASESIVGFIHRQDPAEKQQLTLIVALVNFGEKLPVDEIAAIGR